MAGSSSDPAVTGPLAFAAVQEHNRPDLVSKQAAEIEDQAAKIKDQAAEIEGLKRKVEESNNALGNALDDRNEIVHKAIKIRTRMMNFQSNMQPELQYQQRVIFNVGMNVFREKSLTLSRWSGRTAQKREKRARKMSKSRAREKSSETAHSGAALGAEHKAGRQKHDRDTQQ